MNLTTRVLFGLMAIGGLMSLYGLGLIFIRLTIPAIIAGAIGSAIEEKK